MISNSCFLCQPFAILNIWSIPRFFELLDVAIDCNDLQSSTSVRSGRSAILVSNHKWVISRVEKLAQRGRTVIPSRRFDLARSRPARCQLLYPVRLVARSGSCRTQEPFRKGPRDSPDGTLHIATLGHRTSAKMFPPCFSCGTPARALRNLSHLSKATLSIKTVNAKASTGVSVARVDIIRVLDFVYQSRLVTELVPALASFALYKDSSFLVGAWIDPPL